MSADLHQTLTAIVDQSASQMLAIPDTRAAQPRASGKWSRKEILGHLIDSAVNNQVRFVTAQVQEDLVFAGYDQDAWVRVQRHQDRSWPDLVQVWRACNAQIAATMRTTLQSEMDRPRPSHNLHEIAFQPLPVGHPATLGFLMRDYVAHLQHHVRQILDT